MKSYEEIWKPDPGHIYTPPTVEYECTYFINDGDSWQTERILMKSHSEWGERIKRVLSLRIGVPEDKIKMVGWELIGEDDEIIEEESEEDEGPLEAIEILKKPRNEWTNRESLHMLEMFEFVRGSISEFFCEKCGNPLDEFNQCSCEETE